MLAIGLNQQELERLARLGARARLEEMRREKDAIFQAFPDLRSGGGARKSRGKRRGGGARASGAAQAAEAPQRRGRSMSSAGRRAVSERMKRYWAERRKEKDKSAKR